MSLDRATILKSPGKLVHDGATIFSEGDITAGIITEHFPVETSAFGPADQRVKDRMIKIALTPKAWSDLTKLFPYATKQLGDTLFGASDLPAVITPRTGAPLTVANCAVTKLPSILLSGHRPILGGLELTGLVANNSDPATVANFFSFGTAASNVAQLGLDLTKIPNTLYTLAYNSVNYRSEAGFDFEPDLGLEPDKADGEPTLNMRLTRLEARLRFTPTGITEAQYATLLALGMATAIGAAPTGRAAAVTSSGGPAVTLANTIVTTGRAGYGATLNRTGEIELQSVRTVTSGNLVALWTLA